MAGEHPSTVSEATSAHDTSDLFIDLVTYFCVVVCTVGDKKMVSALSVASNEDREWTGWTGNVAELVLKLLAKRAV